MNNSPLYKGKIMYMKDNATAMVWLTHFHGITAIGQFENIGGNTGSNLHGTAYIDACQTAVECKICTPLKSGAWFSYDSSRDASVFSNKDSFEEEDFVDYRYNPNWTQRMSHGMNNLCYDTDNPQFTLAASNPTLNVSGGTPIPIIKNLPKGNFPKLEPNQNVLVALVQGTTSGVILGILPSDREIKTILG